MHMDRYINRQTHWDSTDENDDDAHGIYLCMYIVSYLYRTHIYIYTYRWIHREIDQQTQWDSTHQNDDDAHGIYLHMHIVLYLYRTHILSI